MKIETERLMIRLVQPEDLDPLMKLWTDPDVTQFVGGPREEEDLKKNFMEDIENPERYTYDLWPVIEKESSKLVGHCGILDKEIEEKTEYELNYFFSKDVWGKGYATEVSQALKKYAKKELKLNRLVAIIDPENSSSQHVAEKVGMHMKTEIVRPDSKVKRLFVVNL